MVCVAAFIILAICVLTVPIIRLFNKKLAKNIMALFKKSMHCFSRRVTLRKCDTSFKDDIKNSLLRKVVLKHPKWVKPLSGAIEVASVLIVIITIWSLLVGVKSLISLYVYGTCNVTNPNACLLGTSESCSIDAAPIDFTKDPIGWTGNWFKQYGDAIVAIPTRMKHWEAKDYLPDQVSYYGGYKDGKPLAVDIFDPGCIICNRSFNNQKSTGFFDKYNVVLLPYPIKSGTTSNGYKFQNSYLVSSYLVAVQLKPLKDAKNPVAWQIAERMYTSKTKDGDSMQNAFNVGYSADKAESVLKDWLKDFGYSDDQIKEIAKLAHSDQVKKEIDKNYDIVDNKVKTKMIPTMIFNGNRHDGEFKKDTKF